MISIYSSADAHMIKFDPKVSLELIMSAKCLEVDIYQKIINSTLAKSPLVTNWNFCLKTYPCSLFECLEEHRFISSAGTLLCLLMSLFESWSLITLL